MGRYFHEHRNPDSELAKQKMFPSSSQMDLSWKAGRNDNQRGRMLPRTVTTLNMAYALGLNQMGHLKPSVHPFIYKSLQFQRPLI